MSPAQNLIPGFVGVAAPTNGAYLRALHANSPDGSTGKALNRLKSVLYEMDFAEFAQHVRAGEWQDAERQIAQAAKRLEAAGADFLVVTSNTGNTLTRMAAEQCPLPILDVVRPVMSAVQGAGCRRAGLLGTKRTLASSVFQDAGAHYDLEVMAPPGEIADAIEKLIMTELIYGEVTSEGVGTMTAAARWFASCGADALILGCTDMTHLAARVRDRTTLFVADTTPLHAAAAAGLAWRGPQGHERSVSAKFPPS